MEYIKAMYLISKPFLTYFGIKTSFLITTYTSEWYTGRLYSIYCIGEGFNGYFNHIWNMASPSCTGLLATHISLLGIFITSVGLTIISWILYIYNNHIKNDYIKTKKIIGELNN